MAIATVQFATNNRTLYAYLAGEIDHDSAQYLRVAMDEKISGDAPSQLVLDFGQVSFMDSSGLGLILGRKRRMQTVGGQLAVQHPPEQIEKILQLVEIQRVEV